MILAKIAKYVPSYVLLATAIFVCDSDRSNVRSKSPRIKKQQNRKPLEPGVSCRPAINSAKMARCARSRQFALRFSLSRLVAANLTAKVSNPFLTFPAADTVLSDFKESTGKLIAEI